MDFNPKIPSNIWATVIGVVSTFIGSLLGRKVFIKLMDWIAKPLYDFCIRKGFMKIEAVKASKAQEKLKKADTLEAQKKAVDEIP